MSKKCLFGAKTPSSLKAILSFSKEHVSIASVVSPHCGFTPHITGEEPCPYCGEAGQCWLCKKCRQCSGKHCSEPELFLCEVVKSIRVSTGSTQEAAGSTDTVIYGGVDDVIVCFGTETAPFSNKSIIIELVPGVIPRVLKCEIVSKVQTLSAHVSEDERRMQYWAYDGEDQGRQPFTLRLTPEVK